MITPGVDVIYIEFTMVPSALLYAFHRVVTWSHMVSMLSQIVCNMVHTIAYVSCIGVDMPPS